jgi:hypothetical protein
VLPVVNTQDVTVAVGYRNTQTGTVTYTSEITPETTTDEAPFNIEARYVRARFTIAEDATWDRVQGGQFRFNKAGGL